MADTNKTPATETLTWTVKHSHGTATEHASYDDAVEGLRSVYGEDIEIEGSEADLLAGHCDRALVWTDEASAQDDDGARAVASIRRGSLS